MSPRESYSATGKVAPHVLPLRRVQLPLPRLPFLMNIRLRKKIAFVQRGFLEVEA